MKANVALVISNSMLEADNFYHEAGKTDNILRYDEEHMPPNWWRTVYKVVFINQDDFKIKSFITHCFDEWRRYHVPGLFFVIMQDKMMIRKVNYDTIRMNPQEYLNPRVANFRGSPQDYFNYVDYRINQGL